MLISLAINRIYTARRWARELRADDALCHSLFFLPELVLVRLRREPNNTECYLAFCEAVDEAEALLVERAEMLGGPLGSNPFVAAAAAA